jgi:hypothetical protein
MSFAPRRLQQEDASSLSPGRRKSSIGAHSLLVREGWCCVEHLSARTSHPSQHVCLSRTLQRQYRGSLSRTRPGFSVSGQSDMQPFTLGFVSGYAMRSTGCAGETGGLEMSQACRCLRLYSCHRARRYA